MSTNSWKKPRVLYMLIICVGLFLLAYTGYRSEMLTPLRRTYLQPIPPWAENYKQIVDEVTKWRNFSMEVFRKAPADCEDFLPSFGENINVALRYMKNTNVSTQTLQMLQLDDVGVSELTNHTNSSAYPVILAGISENHFREVEGLIKSVHEHLLNKSYRLHFIVYDLGLSNSSLELLEKYCRCEIRKFPFEMYPLHILDVRRYTWKPILIQMALQEFDFVMWMDSSIRLTNHSLFPLFQAASHRGIQIRKGGGSLAFRTNRNTFRRLQEDPCRFIVFPEMETGWVLVKRNPFIMTAVMRPWVTCAIEPGCMSPLDFKNYIHCHPDRQYIGACHRFDQSVLGIILTRIFNYRINFVYFISKSEFGSVQRRDSPWYFPRPTQYHLPDFKKPMIWAKNTIKSVSIKRHRMYRKT